MSSLPAKLWSRLFGTSGSESVWALTTGLDGSIYISGSTDGSLDGQTSSGGNDAFVTKYNSDGTKVWTRLLGTSGDDISVTLTTGLDGSIYVAGNSNGALDGQTSSGGYDAFVTKYSADGTKVWTRLLGTVGEDTAYALTTGLDGSIYVSGYSDDSLDGQTNSGGADAFVTKYSPDGTKVWTKLLGTSGSDASRALTTGLDGSIYVSGQTTGSLDGQANSGGADAFVTKYSADGTKVWTRLLGSESDEIAYAITTGLDDSIYVSGYNRGSFDGQAYSGGSTDTFVTKYSADGTKVWTKLLGTSASDISRALTTGLDGSIFVSGYTGGALDSQTSSGGTDAFITKYSADGTKVWTKLLGTSGSDISRALTIGLDGSIFVSGQTTGSLDGQINSGGLDAFVVKFQDLEAIPTFAISSTSSSINEGSTATFALTTTNVASGTPIAYSLYGIGITASDILSGMLAGSVVVDSNGKATISIPIASDLTTEGAETFAITVNGSSATVMINDTSLTPPTIALSANKTALIAGDKSSLTFTLSESSTNFVASDITVTGGTLSNFTGSGATYTAVFTPTANSTTNGVISVGSGVFTGAAGNANADGSDANNKVTLAVDTVTPTIALITSKTSLIAGDTSNLTFSLSQASTTFTSSDVTVYGGTLTNFSGSGTSYTALFTPTANSTTSGVVSVGSGVFTGTTGNANADGSDENNKITLAIDTVTPTIDLSTSKIALISGDKTTLTFTLSEASTTFNSDDVTVTGGTLSNFTGNGITYTALFTPAANSTTNGTISVTSGIFTDTAGNANADGSEANNTVTLAIDTVVPTIALSSTKTSLIAGDTATLTFTLSEASTNFAASDVAATGGTLSSFSGFGTTYSALFTPTANSTTSAVVRVSSGVFTDTAGNTNADGSDTNNSITLAVDTVAPTIALSASKSSLITGDITTLTFTLSESSSNFAVGDVTVTGGTLSNFSGSGATYIALFTPTADSTTNGVISIASGVLSDAAGNVNSDGAETNNSISLSVDTLIPTIAVSSNKSSLQGGDSATLTFTLSEAAINFLASDITVTGGTLSNFTGSGTSYSATFTLVSNSAVTGAVTIANGVFTDAAGNKNADGSDANNSVNFSRIPTITNEIHTLSVIVDKNVLGPDAVLLKGLKESMTFTNGAITKHIIEYSGLTFDYNQIDSLITTVTRDGEFTAEFTKEINDYLGTELNITYSAAIKLVGTASIDGVVLAVAGSDGNYVG